MIRPNKPLHVVPRGDAIEHALNDECVCGPRVEFVQDGGKIYGWVVIHASLDGRELREDS